VWLRFRLTINPLLPKTKEEIREQERVWHIADRKKNPEKYRLRELVSTFGPGADKHNLEQLKQQRGNCGLCGLKLTDKQRNRNQDHNHETSQLRGVLCRRCNIGLHYMENLEWKQSAERYLHRWTR